jgi:hypothetical protein
LESKPLHQALKLHCVTAETSVMGFVVKALEEKLAGLSEAPARRRRVKA